MQQTKTNKFNLIEPSDAFLPAALNENMQKVETALANTQKQLSQQITSAEKQLDQRVAALEVHKLVIGTDKGSNRGIVNLGFTPKVVLLYGSHGVYFTIEGYKMGDVRIQEGGFNYQITFAPCIYAAFI